MSDTFTLQKILFWLNALSSNAKIHAYAYVTYMSQSERKKNRIDTFPYTTYLKFVEKKSVYTYTITIKVSKKTELKPENKSV